MKSNKKATIVSFRRGRRTYTPRHFIVQIEGIETKKEAEKFIGKAIEWKSPTSRIIKGKIASTHGNKGLLRAIFEKGLPGQAINTEAFVE